MIRLEIIKKENYLYSLKSEEGKEYNFILEFWDLEKELKAGDYININEELLNQKYEGYSSMYAFGSLESKYGKSNISMDDIDVIKVEAEELEVYLKRLYG